MSGPAVNGSIRDATTAADIASARTLFAEYAASLGVDLAFQDFESELAGLPGEYAPPRGCLLLLRRDAANAANTAGVTTAAEAIGCRRQVQTFDAGCVALRPIGAHTAELKRLYLRAEARRGGWGRRLALAAIERARSLGYREIKLDTLATMAAAQTLYASLGFVPCAPYYRNPLPGTVYLALVLGAGRRIATREARG
ncbi:MAG: GNAT family N-acetyltransferase [Proteobacteria bacterium]|nr:GNAT family N-acetyltransferase [Pseudomonadota bacterium]